MARGYTSYPFQGFGAGLNLRDKPDSTSPAECIDALNVTFSDRGAIQQRDGYAALTASALTNRVDSLSPFYTAAGTKQLLAGCGTRLEAIGTDGRVVASATGLTGGPWAFARFGQPNSEVAYAGNGTDTLRKWDGSAWSAPSGVPKARFLAVQSTDNRLVATGYSTTTGGPASAASSPSHVYFSDPGDPETWGANSYVQLTPGDGEAIQGVIAWREFIFVFKETRFFVFYGTSTDSSGNPIFNYRPVEAGAGLASPRAICAHPSGIYFMSRNGVYRTTGQEPELVSSPVEPIWSGDISPFYTGGTLSHGSITNCAMHAHGDLIYLAFPTSSANDRTLVYDPQFDWWSLLSIPASAMATFRAGNAPELVFGYASGSNHIGRHSSSYTNDDGSAINSRWRSGWFDLDNPDVKTLRSRKLWGTGKVSTGLGKDFEQGVGTLDLLDFSDATADRWDRTTWGGGTWAEPRGLIQRQCRRAVRGTTFSVYFENSTLDQDWSVHRAVHHLREVRKPSAVSA